MFVLLVVGGIAAPLLFLSFRLLALRGGFARWPRRAALLMCTRCGRIYTRPVLGGECLHCPGVALRALTRFEYAWHLDDWRRLAVELRVWSPGVAYDRREIIALAYALAELREEAAAGRVV